MIKQNSAQQKKLSDINKMIDAGDYHTAVTKLELMARAGSVARVLRAEFDYLSLKAFNRLQWLVEAASIVSRVADSKEPDSKGYLEVGLFYVLTAQLEEAEFFLKRAIALDKRSTLLASELGILYEQQGKSDKALKIYDRILSKMFVRKRIDAVGARVLNRLAGLRKLEKGELKQVDALCLKYAGQEPEVSILFGLAKAYGKLDVKDEEIKSLKKANNIADRNNESLPQAQTIQGSQLRLKAIQVLFDRPCPSWMPEYFTSDRRPVFILGMPRSGTTLLEQILGAHSLVGNSGESRGMGIAFQRCLVGKPLLKEDEGSSLPFLRYKALDYADSKSIISYYDRYQSLLSNKEVVTDKELSNIDRVGIILKLYPAAKFICVQRHPLDVCVSILQHDFSQAYFSGSSLKIVQEYETYNDKARHWEAMYPESVSMIRYESLVSEFESSVSQLLDFLGLPWDDNVKHFYRRKNSVRTPSLSQVRSTISLKSVGKWKQYKELVVQAEQYLVSRGVMLE